ncbi:MAG: pilus assembly protein TadG-related protein [Rhizobiaceae bacterium]
MFHNLSRFLKDKRGAYGPLFAILTVPLFGTAAAAIEYSRMTEARTDIQVALDAAALATAKEMSFNQDEAYLKTYARNFFDANLDDTIDTAEIGFNLIMEATINGGNNVRLTADYDHGAILGKFIGVEEFDMAISSTVAAGNRTVEVAIVVDNSGSMNSYTGSTYSTRIERARTAAENLVNSLFSVASMSNKPDPMKVALVPFGSSVNIGGKYRGASWLDRFGWSSVHHENLDWIGTNTRGDQWPNSFAISGGFKSGSTFTNTLGPSPSPYQSGAFSAVSTQWLSRWTLFDALDVSWAGCVEMRPWPYHTTDDAPSELVPDTLFVPMFAPDEPDYVHRDEDDDYQNNYLNDYRRVGADYPTTSYTSRNYTRQLWRESWTAKYNQDAPWTRSEARNDSTKDEMGKSRSRDLGTWGPNQGCTTNPIQELSADKNAVINSIRAMEGGGFTNVQAGIIWGWRALSQNEPFAEGRSYDTPENDKYIIVLTDGNNTYPSQSTWNETEYYSWGYGKDERVFDGINGWQTEIGAMNIHTATTCDNIKAVQDADGESAYRIFTIAYDVSDGSSVKDLLYNCASTGPNGQKYYYDVSGDAIADAMTAIGNEISDLRLAK